MARAVTAEDVVAAARDVMLAPWQWGQADCTASVCDVALLLFGVDPMAPYRGTYATREQADALTGAAGGFLAMIASVAQASGFEPVSGPAWPGDIGVTIVGVHEPDRRALAICAGAGGWLCKSPRGFTVVHDVETAWRFAG